jgi:TRAP-type uncharacterized transport system fused permease subunit
VPGVIALVVVFAAARALMGPALPIIAGLFLAGGFRGQHLPSPLSHRGSDFAQVIDHMAYATEGTYVIPVCMSSICTFFSSSLAPLPEKAGMIRLFTDVSVGLVGHRQGGPARVSGLS